MKAFLIYILLFLMLGNCVSETKSDHKNAELSNSASVTRDSIVTEEVLKMPTTQKATLLNFTEADVAKFVVTS